MDAATRAVIERERQRYEAEDRVAMDGWWRPWEQQRKQSADTDVAWMSNEQWVEWVAENEDRQAGSDEHKQAGKSKTETDSKQEE